MPRATRYMLKGYTYHLTHRCHNKQYLLRFKKDRDAYRKWLWIGMQRHEVAVYGYCITSNHTHVIVHVEDTNAVASMMALASGATGQAFNIRSGREGSVWEHPYHCTMIQDGKHLLNCMRYVDLNMVRAGAVAHPKAWSWCGYDELSGRRKRYCILDLERLAEVLGQASVKDLQELHCERIEAAISRGQIEREAHWTESLAIGDTAYIANAQNLYGMQRSRLLWEPLSTIHYDATIDESADYILKEDSISYNSFLGGEKRV